MCNTTIAKLARTLCGVILATFVALSATVFAQDSVHVQFLERAATHAKPELVPAYQKGVRALKGEALKDEIAASLLDKEAAGAEKVATEGGPNAAFAKQDAPALRAAAAALRSGSPATQTQGLKTPHAQRIALALSMDPKMNRIPANREAVAQSLVLLEGGEPANGQMAMRQIGVILVSIDRAVTSGMKGIKDEEARKQALENAALDKVAFTATLEAWKKYLSTPVAPTPTPASEMEAGLKALGLSAPPMPASAPVTPASTPAPASTPLAPQPTPTPPQPSPAAPAAPTVEKPAATAPAAPSAPPVGSPVAPAATGGATGSNLPIGRTGLPVARWVPGKPGLIFALDGDPMHQNDVSGYAPGVIATCTFSGKKFEVPEAPAVKVIWVSKPRPTS